MLMIFSEISLNELALGKENFQFLWEVLLRTSIMVCIIILGVKILGKRSVKQLSIFELVVIIGLGSAAGDPMFYSDVGIIAALIVFIVVICFYRLVTYLVERFDFIENFMEGKPQILIRDGKFIFNENSSKDLGTEELFSALRMDKVSQIGQIRMAIEEINGEISIFFFEEENVKYGLPILPGSCDNPLEFIQKEGKYACTFCGNTESKSTGNAGNCPVCHHDKWVEASNEKRI